MAAFLGVKSTEVSRDQSRLVGFNPRFELNCALMVDRLSGLRSDDQLVLQPDDQAARPAFVGARYYVEKPANGPEWGLRFGLTFLFPK